jgi:hypothetical protein
MAEWYQSPAYLARQAAGEVVTPGLVDWGGMGNDIYKFLQAPYEARVARERASAPQPPSMDPLEVMSRANYVPTPRFGTLPPKVAPSPKVTLQNPYPGPTPVAKTQDRLAPLPAGLPLQGGDEPIQITVKGGKSDPYKGYQASPRWSTVLGAQAPKQSAGPEIIRLSFEPMSEVSGQNFANSSGKPVSGPSGKVYYPSNAPQSGVRAPMRPVAASAQAPAAQRTSGGWLSSLFGGGNEAPRTQAVAQPTSGPAIYTPQGNVHPGSFYDNSGNDMAFMPQAYRDNPRNSNGGY